ncbi:hypothetical protein [Herbaspirillum sp. C7C8]|uniref:hypothetical protein n=1 Tax=Herbaspirillum sp. C7C8 TaxID=2736665 RepID=UPI001F520F85|nr:hypothetical protein [Herbaspirillum sp. C7C8]MCI1005023.1 hypothetical protein [Herbaspirillum sp. C7C8]
MNNDELLGRILALEAFVNAVTTKAPQEFMNAVSREFSSLLESVEQSIAHDFPNRPDLAESFSKSAAALQAHHRAPIH